MEIVYLVAALAGVALVLGLIRRAAGGGKERSGRERPTPQPEVDGDDYDDYDDDDAKADDDGEQPEGDGADADDQDADDQDADDEYADDEYADEDEPEGAGESERLKQGLAKTRGGFVARLGRLFARKKIDEDLLDDLEEVLFTADIGPKTASKLVSGVKDKLSKSELTDSAAIWSQLREQSATILKVDSPPIDFSSQHPFVLLVLGVNGVGKTTTIGKLAGKLTGSGKKVLLAAGDTFRAAAVEQLQEWGKRAGCEVVRGSDKADPSSVIFDAIKRGQDEGVDVVIADTAGRLHTRVELMDELKKVRRVIEKAQPGAPHETWLVVDSTNGQNAIQQAMNFRDQMEVTGIVLTKLDGTAKGGVILGICDELAVPVRFIGIGESIDDLREFDPDAFVAALYDEVEADAA